MVSKIKPDLVSKSGDNILEYFDKSHQYKLNGQYIKSVTGVGKGYPTPEKLIEWRLEQGKKKANKIMKEAGEIGTFIHEYVYRKRMGIKDFDDLKAQLKGHKNEAAMRVGLQSANMWLAHTNNKLLKAEVICCSPTLNVAGKFDELAEDNESKGVVDYKTSGSLSITHFQQTAGYRRMIKEWFGIDTEWLKLVHLPKDFPGFHEAVIDSKGLWYDGQLRIEDPIMMQDMEDQFARNIPTSEYLKKYENFWEALR